MSHPTPRRLGLAAAGLVLLAAPSAAIASPYGMRLSSNALYECGLPFEDRQPTTIATDSTYWQAVPAGSRYNGNASVRVSIASGLTSKLIARGAASATVTGIWRWRVIGPSGETTEEVSLAPTTFALADVQAITVADSVPAPERILDAPGDWTFALDALQFTVKATDASGAAVDLDLLDDTRTDGQVSCSGPHMLVGRERTIPTYTATLGGTGTIALRSPLSGTAPIRGDLSAKYDGSGWFGGTATFGPATATFKAFGGLLPVRATLAFTPVGTASGQHGSSSFSFTSRQDIAIKSVYAAGIRLASGTCHTAVPPTITLTSTGNASLQSGGSASGAFTLGRLTGCSTLGSLVGTNGGSTSLVVKYAPAPANSN